MPNNPNLPTNAPTPPNPDTPQWPAGLRAAYNGACELATAANGLAEWLRMRWVGDSEEGRSIVLNLLCIIDRTYEPTFAAIQRVKHELCMARDLRHARFGDIVTSTAHEAALALARRVEEEIRNALTASAACRDADPEAWAQFIRGRGVIDAEFVVRHLPEVCKHFRARSALLPDGHEIVAELPLEASRAAALVGRPPSGAAPTGCEDETPRNDPSPVIWALGERTYRVGDRPPRVIDETEDYILQTFREKSAMDLPTLAQRSGLGEKTGKVINRLCRKYGGEFGQAIRRPGKRGQGGYSADVRAALPKS